MDILTEITNEIVTTMSELEPSSQASSRKRRATLHLAPIVDEPAASNSETLAASQPQQASRSLSPTEAMPAAPHSETPAKRRTRRANAAATPVVTLPAATLSASGGADEAIPSPPTKGLAPRRQKTRAVHSFDDTRVEIDSTAGLTNASDPTSSKNDAGDRVSRSDHLNDVPHHGPVAAAPLSDGEPVRGDDGARKSCDTQGTASPVVAQIIALWRLRTAWWKAELKLILQAQAICRQWTDGNKTEAAKLFAKAKSGGDVDPALSIALAPFLAGMEPFAEQGALYEKQIAKHARSLPVHPWVKGVWGFSDLALGKIVGEAGDIGSYRNPSCLWKRMGLAPYKGKAPDQWRKHGGLTAEEWELLGYSPRRRSTMWNIGNGLIGGMGKGVRPLVGEDWQSRADWSPYQKLYVRRLIDLAERDTEEFARPATEAGKLSFSKHAHNAAKMYVEKRALKDLWSAWRRANGEAGE